ncbi:hypothetical protein [Robertkochia aurantiaca]|uniref:hypothetical protein n=1 Tax=Robertkochia aurantiaca TaxID=2873700 RepID=UPI001CC9A5E6|nr:hypothetical protein [Robertkochia sp. 3YJGBD-33]
MKKQGAGKRKTNSLGYGPGRRRNISSVPRASSRSGSMKDVSSEEQIHMLSEKISSMLERYRQLHYAGNFQVESLHAAYLYICIEKHIRKLTVLLVNYRNN